MKKIKNIYNIIISGVGGQGVFSLTKALWGMCLNNNINCQGSVFKGGAQRMGTIHSTLRLFSPEIKDYSSHSVQIMSGELDLIIGLEPWETLRYQNYFGDNTKIIMDTTIYPLFVDRYKGFLITDPVHAIERMGLSTISKNYTKQSQKKHGTKKMANYEIGLEFVKMDLFPFTDNDLKHAFAEVVQLPSTFTEETH